MNKNPMFRDVDSDHDVYTFKEFGEMERMGVLTPDDGSGCWSDGAIYDLNSNIYAPSPAPDWATHVVWFNR